MSLFDRLKKEEKQKIKETTADGSDIYEYDEGDCKSSLNAV